MNENHHQYQVHKNQQRLLFYCYIARGFVCEWYPGKPKASALCYHQFFREIWALKAIRKNKKKQKKQTKKPENEVARQANKTSGHKVDVILIVSMH